VDDVASRLEALRRARIIADPRKFREYVLVPGNARGKDRLILGTLGFRPHSADDAWELVRIYEEQASQRISSGDIEFAGTIAFGDRYTIEIVVRGVTFRSGWLLSDDVLCLTTPFTGFAREIM
jgi:hypothetical protein